MDPILRPIIDREELIYLSQKTMAFLQLIAHPSSALYIDYKILKHTGLVTGLVPPEGPNTSSSFSSNATGDVPMGR